MYNKEFINKFYHYWKQRWNMFDYSRGWLKGHCPDCGKLKFGIHLYSNSANCFYCGVKPRPVRYAMQLENVQNFNELRKLIYEYDGVGFDHFERISTEARKVIERNVNLPESYKLISMGDNFTGKQARKYMKSRGFKISQLERAGIGYCDKGEYKAHIIIPYYIWGELIYFNARKFMGAGAKFNNPKEEDIGIGKNQVLYNQDALFTYNTVWLLESATNCLTMGDKAVGLGGKTLSETQISTILRSPAKRFIVGLDRDATLWALKIALRLVKQKKVKVIIFPDDRDVNDLGKKKTLKLSKQFKYLSYGKLLSLKNKYEKDTEFTYQ